MGQIITLCLSFILPLLLARLLSKHDYGIYAQFNVLLVFFTNFFSLGLSSELYYSYPTANQEERRISIFQSFISLLGVASITFCILYIPAIKNHIITDKAIDDTYFFLVLSIFLSIPLTIITALYLLENDNKTSIFYLPSMTLLRVGLMLIFYFITPTIQSLLLGLVTSIILNFIFVLYYTSKTIKKNKGNRLVDKIMFIKQLKYSIPLGIANSTRIFIQQIDKLIIMSFVSPAIYAIYSIAFYGVPGLSQIYISISQAYIPKMSIAFKENNISKLISIYHSMVQKTISYTLPIILIICLYAQPIITTVFSNKYIDSVPYFQIYLITFIIQAIGCGNILRATGETKYSLNTYIYTAIIILPFTYFTIKYFNLNGAIVSATIGAILPKIILTIYDAKTIKTKILSLYPWTKIGIIGGISFLSLVPFVIGIFICGLPSFIITIVLIIVYLSMVALLELRFNVFILSRRETFSILKKIIKYEKNIH